MVLFSYVCLLDGLGYNLRGLKNEPISRESIGNFVCIHSFCVIGKTCSRNRPHNCFVDYIFVGNRCYLVKKKWGIEE